MPSPRTHVVDLGCMPRENLIEIAKKQANQIREKNTRISAMEAFIESLTGTSAEESLSQLPHANSSTPPHNSSTATPAFSAESGTGTPATASASQLLQLQQTQEEEQLQRTLRVSELEEQLRERQREYDQLQAKVDAWKTKVMAIMIADQERIRVLEAQLAAAAATSHESSSSSAPLNAPFGVTAAPSPDAGESYMTTQLQQLQAPVSAPQQELRNVREEPQQAQSQLHEQHRSTLQALLPPAAATVTTENLMSAPPAALRPPPSTPSEELPGKTLPLPPAPITAADIPPEVLQEAVHLQLASWKEQVETAMLADKSRIQDLEVQLAALGTATSVDHACEAERAAETEALRAEVGRLQEALEAAERERDLVQEADRSEVESYRAAFKRQITELNCEIDELRAAAAAAKEDRGATLSACAAELAAETEALRAEVGRLQEALEAAERDRDDAAVSMKAFKAKMDEWKAKVRSVVENGELQRRALEAEVQRLKEDRVAAGAGGDASCSENRQRKDDDESGAASTSVDRKEAWSQTDVVADASEDSTAMRPAAGALQDVAVQTSIATEVPLQVVTDVASVPSPVALPELHLQSMQALLMECERAAMENRRLQRVFAQLSRFREEVMREVHAVAAPPSAPAS
ncbi:protein of unknown function - conserved [Leishmania donovani]|uniref:Uncharacterized protein n=3 Tax=Leishmania donovani species complex TaxID=38574 RepID=A4HT87_LEIIN|nr:conserved hypothetical protein [Leishmania infantum JPCM5]CAC9448790.1 hypothetical_protein_-_conserved [Leishmania infantum]CAJ1986302.1 protein of unknown function - conserved [Leishmania donovani]CAM65634.1 conserved hypothetical protein [Leishmania infantum JPCM5]SUZ39250.1 hypothetical_protein_-_conserved [Leishmania infantum]VDZ42200.1 hypothetical_protein_conserved [Leishmania donovani]|eukprot:XP_001463278.1 conserved hypothetical protein [Leishmania infantum JPCM5]